MPGVISFSDAPIFWRIGVPSIFNSISHQAENVGSIHGSAKLGWWWHTPHDTLDKIDPDNLVRDTRIFLQAVWELLSEEVLPLDCRAHADDLGAILAELQCGVKERLDLSASRPVWRRSVLPWRQQPARRSAQAETLRGCTKR